MSNGFIGDRSWRAEATFAALGSQNASYPVTHMQHYEMQRVWRSPNALAANTKFKITLPKLRPVNFVALCNLDIARPSGRIKVTGYSDTAATVQVMTSDWRSVWPVVYSLTDAAASWDSGNAWDRTYTADDIQNRNIDKAVYFEQEYSVRTLIVEIDSTSIVEVGICEIGAGFYLPLNFDYGAQYGIRSRSQVITAAGGSPYTQAETPDDVFVGQTSMIERQSALGTFYEWQRRCDKHTPFWWSPDTEDTLNALRHSYLALNEEIGLNTYAAWQRDSVPFNFKRVL